MWMLHLAAGVILEHFLDQLNEQGRLFAFDQDQDAHENRIEDSRFQLVAANFSHLSHYLKYHGISSVNGILADFGVSSHQFDQASRGFFYAQRGTVGHADESKPNLGRSGGFESVQ